MYVLLLMLTLNLSILIDCEFKLRSSCKNASRMYIVLNLGLKTKFYVVFLLNLSILIVSSNLGLVARTLVACL